MEEIRPEFGQLFGPKKGIRDAENSSLRIRLIFGSFRFPLFAALIRIQAFVALRASCPTPVWGIHSATGESGPENFWAEIIRNGFFALPSDSARLPSRRRAWRASPQWSQRPRTESRRIIAHRDTRADSPRASFNVSEEWSPARHSNENCRSVPLPSRILRGW